MRFFLVTLIALVGVGCGESGKPIADAVDFSGKVTDATGKPIGGVEMHLQPLDSGKPSIIPVGADGSFKAKAVAGKYAFSFQMKNGAAAATVPSNYRDGSKDHTISVSSGASLDIKLAP